MSSVIATENLTKHFGSVKAVEGLSIEIERGEIYGFLGLNGAGKTTTIRMLLGMIRPTAGAARIFGQPVSADGRGMWRRVGYLVELPYAYPELTVRENLEAVQRLRGVADRRAVDRILAQLALDRYASRRTRTLSLGNVQRLGLAKALLHHPELLLLDEPANGLDPAGVVEIRELLRRLAAEQGVTILMSSHILTEVARLATRIGIIHQGRLLEQLDTGELERRLRRRLAVQTLDQHGAQQVLTEAGFDVTPDHEGRLLVSGKDVTGHPEEVADLLLRAGQRLTLLAPMQEDLESHFLHMVHDAEVTQ